MVAPIGHTTQQKFLIGSFAISESVHWLKCILRILQYLNQYPPSSNKISTTYTACTCIPIENLTFFVEVVGHAPPMVLYNKKCLHKTNQLHPWEVMRRLNQF